ncbi:ABC transporter permease [Streptomyces sp. NPDC057638]|uniref:ABC transporter permease n=1 Tax=Streptomyces sp. NPDC057638 TaxID=3346190 RepID=UPI0036A7964D
MPVRKAHLGDALTSEWTKIRTVRSTLWTLAGTVVLMVGLGLAVAFGIAATEPDLEEQPVLALGFFGLLVSCVCVITLGTLTITSEFGTGLIRTTLTACPSRARMLTAKAIVLFALVFSLTTVLTVLVGAAQVGIVDQGSPSGDEWLRSTVGASLYVALLALVALGVGAMVRHSAGAITVMTGLVLAPMVLALFMFTPSLAGVQDALLTYSIPSQLAAVYDAEMSNGGPQGWAPLAIITVLAGASLAGGYASLTARDV